MKNTNINVCIHLLYTYKYNCKFCILETLLRAFRYCCLFCISPRLDSSPIRFFASVRVSVCPDSFNPGKISNLVSISITFEGIIIFTPSPFKSSELSVISSKVLF